MTTLNFISNISQIVRDWKCDFFLNGLLKKAITSVKHQGSKVLHIYSYLSAHPDAFVFN